jgi:hypothetical protein
LKCAPFAATAKDKPATIPATALGFR